MSGLVCTLSLSFHKAVNLLKAVNGLLKWFRKSFAVSGGILKEDEARGREKRCKRQKVRGKKEKQARKMQEAKVKK